MSLKLSEVKKLHDKGLALIYLRPNSKRPWEDKWTTGPRHSLDVIENSFEKKNNLGVRLGEPSKLSTGLYLACIDLDIVRPGAKKNALKALERITQGKAFPEVRSGSGNGSRHLYFATKKPFKMVTVVSKKEDRGFEICLYSDGRQMVLPPSTHPDTGFEYDWQTPLDVKNLPVLNPKKFTAARQTSPALDKALEHLLPGEDPFQAVEVDLWASQLKPATIELITDGRGCQDRSAALMGAAMSMCRVGFTDDQILSVLSNPDHYLAGAAYDRRRGRKSAVGWLRKYTLEPARHETSVMRYFDNPPTKKERRKVSDSKATHTAEQLDDDTKRAIDRDGKGNPKPTVKNVVTILEHHMAGALVGYDEFANRAIFLKDTVYGGKAGQEVGDHDDLSLMHHLACHFGVEPSQDHCFKAHALVSKRYKFHPVRQYLKSLEWDGKPRLDSWLEKGFEASGPDEYVRAVARKTLVAAVKRVMEPGCKYDYVTVLEGLQGKGKSMALDVMASTPWFTDGIGEIFEKDVVDQMTGKWVIELGELAGVRKAEQTALKGFLSRKIDRIRPPYGRRSMDFPRQSIFIGSTNEDEYLSDETGNRRYWPVKIHAVHLAWLKRHRDQLWAEALTRYELGEDVYLSKELEKIAEIEQSKRFESDEWEAEVKAYCKKNEEPFITTEIWRAINITNGNGHPTMMDSKRIGRVMARLDYVRAQRKIDKINTKCWVKRYMK